MTYSGGATSWSQNGTIVSALLASWICAHNSPSVIATWPILSLREPLNGVLNKSIRRPDPICNMLSKDQGQLIHSHCSYKIAEVRCMLLKMARKSWPPMGSESGRVAVFQGRLANLARNEVLLESIFHPFLEELPLTREKVFLIKE